MERGPAAVQGDYDAEAVQAFDRAEPMNPLATMQRLSFPVAAGS